MNKSTPKLCYIMLLLLIGTDAFAGQVNIPYTFVAQQPAVATEVNANFNAVKISVDDNDDRIGNLIILVNQLQSNLATANATIASHNARLNSVESNTVLALDGYVMLSTINGYDTAEFTGINVQINSGSGSTHAAVNGLGNLTIGYNETAANAPEFCSDPQYDDSVNCIGNGEFWANNVRRGSHNLVLGNRNSYDDSGGIVTSFNNIINGLSASVLGGRNNHASGTYSTVSGGFENLAMGQYSVVSGGYGNLAAG